MQGKRALVPIVAVLVLGGACSSGNDQAFPDAAPNRLVIITTEGGIVTMNPDGSDVTTIMEAQDDAAVLQPQWSPRTGRLAWTLAGLEGSQIISSDSAGGDRRAFPTSNPAYYLYWAPDGERLTALYDSAVGDVEARYIDFGAETSLVIGHGVPYYFSWDPGSTRMVAHIGTASLDLVETDGSSTELAVASPSFLAPNWTDEGIFYVEGDGIRLDDGSGNSRLVASVAGHTWFTATAKGDRLAVEYFQQGQAGVNARQQAVPVLLPNVVSVVEVATGDVSIVTSTPSGGFFWSPDGESLALLVAGGAQGLARWVVWQDGEVTPLATFDPPQSFLNAVLRFAPQYALSLNFWAPDSSAIAFVGEIDGASGVWVQGIDGSTPQLVADGTWVAWSRN